MAGHAGIAELKKRQRSVETARQVSGAMKTVSAAKYARCSSRRGAFAAYAAACGELARTFGGALAARLRPGKPDAPACLVLFSSNRGLCGSFNHDLFAFADELLAADPDAVVISCQKQISAHLTEIGRSCREIPIPDVPDPADAAFGELYGALHDGFTGGEFSSVTLVYQKYENVLSQKPTAERLLPFGGGTDGDISENSEKSEKSAAGPRGGEEVFCFPDRNEVLDAAAALCLRAALFGAVLNAATGAQAATLTAMRSACDNAEESGRQIAAQISRMRQSAITEGVIETSSDLFAET